MSLARSNLSLLPTALAPSGSCSTLQSPATSATRWQTNRTLRQPGPLLYHAMVLFHHIVQVFAPTQANSPWQRAFLFQRFHCRRKSWVLVHVDHPRHGIAGRAQSLSEEPFGSCGITPGGEQKIDRLAGGIPFGQNIHARDCSIGVGRRHVLDSGCHVADWAQAEQGRGRAERCSCLGGCVLRDNALGTG